MKKGHYVAVILACLLLFLIFIRRRRRSEYDDFFSDTEIVKDFNESPAPTVVPNSLMNSQIESGNGNSECEQGGYVDMTLTNPSTVPITVDLINLGGYFSGGSGSVATSTALPGCVGIINSYNGFIYTVNPFTADLYITNATLTPSTTVTVSLSPNDFGGSPGVGNIMFYNGFAYIGGNAYVSVINTATGQLVDNILLPGQTNLNSENNKYMSVYGSNIYVVSTDTGTNDMIVSVINSITNTIIQNITSSGGPYGSDIIFPQYNNGATYPKCYIITGGSTTLTVFDFTLNTFLTTIICPSLSGIGVPGCCLVNNLLYIPGINGVDIINVVTDTFVGTISIPGVGVNYAVYNGQNSVYVNLTSGNIAVININTNTVVATIVTGLSFLSATYIFQGTLYTGTTDTSGNILSINAKEQESLWNTIEHTYNVLPANSFQNISLYSYNGNNNIIIAGFSNAPSFDFSGAFATVPTLPPLPDNQIIGLNNMQNFINNPGEICGIFYRSLTVAQMQNVFSVNFTAPTGEVSDYKLIPITHKDPMSVLNQIYISKFFKPILINNGLSIFHVINPGENIYIKIYVRNFMSNVEMLKTGKIKISSTSSTSVFRGGDVPEPDEEQQDSEEEWMTVEEVEEGEWQAVHIENNDEQAEDEEEIE